MRELNDVWQSAVQAIDTAASNPKVATVYAAATVAAGSSITLDIVRDTIGIVSITIGTMTGAVVLAIQLIKLIRVWKAWQANAPEPEDLK